MVLISSGALILKNKLMQHKTTAGKPLNNNIYAYAAESRFEVIIIIFQIIKMRLVD